MTEVKTTLPRTMKAWQYGNTSGGLRNLHLNPSAIPPKPPAAGSQQVLIEVISMSLNPADYKVPELPVLPRFLIPKPASPGLDFSGRIVALPPDITFPPNPKANSDQPVLKPGQLVFGRLDWPYQHGTLGQFILCPLSGIAPLPPGVTPDQGAALATTALTAYQSIAPYLPSASSSAPASASPSTSTPNPSRIFINGGSGGVGLFSIQIAKLLNSHVVASCSTPNVALCLEMGADEVIDYSKKDLLAELRARPHEFDLIVDNVALPFGLFRTADQCLRPGGVYVQVAAADAGLRGVASMLYRWLVPGWAGGGRRRWVFFMVRNSVRELVRVGEWVGEGKLRVRVEESFAFGEAREAVERLRSGRVRGKIVVRVGEEA